MIRLRGLGQGASRASIRAMLLLTIRLRAPRALHARGLEPAPPLPIEIEEAVLGGSVRVPTLTGAVSMKIPPMTNSGRTFRLRGKGLPGKSGHGDLLATTEIRLPETVDEALMEYARKRKEAEV